MIKVLKFGEVDNSRIISRMAPEQDVSSIVRDIIADVVRNKDRALI